jgi:threonine dehydrogenase-like Zn-dependent dehydrogenase
MSDYLELKGKRALVTGGTKGVGQAVVATLREAGATVLTTARSQPERADHSDQFVAADVSTAEGGAVVAQAVRERLPDLAAGLVRLQVDVIVAEYMQASLSAKGATPTIPIIMVGVASVGSASSPLAVEPPPRWWSSNARPWDKIVRLHRKSPVSNGWEHSQLVSRLVEFSGRRHCCNYQERAMADHVERDSKRSLADGAASNKDKRTTAAAWTFPGRRRSVVRGL